MPSRRSSAQKTNPPREPAPPYDPPATSYEVTAGDMVRNWEERLSAILEDHQLRVSENIDIQCLFSPSDDEMRAVRRAESRFPGTVFDVLRTLEHCLEAFWAWKQSPSQRPTDIADRARNRSGLRIVREDSMALWVSTYNWIAKLHSAVQGLRENLEGLLATDECSLASGAITTEVDSDFAPVRRSKYYALWEWLNTNWIPQHGQPQAKDELDKARQQFLRVTKKNHPKIAAATPKALIDAWNDFARQRELQRDRAAR